MQEEEGRTSRREQKWESKKGRRQFKEDQKWIRRGRENKEGSRQEKVGRGESEEKAGSVGGAGLAGQLREEDWGPTDWVPWSSGLTRPGVGRTNLPSFLIKDFVFKVSFISSTLCA